MKELARIHRRTAILALLAVLAVAASTAHAGSLYDVAADFSVASNPNGVWSYGYENSLGSSLQLYDVSTSQGGGIPGLEAWNSSQLDVLGTPGIGYNSTASDITSGTDFFPAHGVVFAPGPNGQYCVIRWTSPTAGTYDLLTAFSGNDFVFPTSTDVHVLLDGTSLFSGGVYVFGPAASFTDTISVKAGDTIDFAVGIGSDGSFIGDNTGISATISTFSGVPEPGSLTLLGSGFLALLAGIRGWGRRHG